MGAPLIPELTPADAAQVVAMLRGAIARTVGEAVAVIERELPEYTRLQAPEHAGFLRRTVERSITGFLALLVDRDAPQEELLAFFRDVGVTEAEEGLSMEVSQSAFRLGAGVTIQRLTAAAERHPAVTAGMIAQVADEVLGYLSRVAEAVAQGHADSRARAAGGHRQRRGELIEALLDPAGATARVADLAALTGWRLPGSVAAVALADRQRTRRGLALPPDVLIGLHRDEPCLIVPDPDGPGRAAAVRAGLRHWDSAIGPTVGLDRVRHSLRLARRTLELPRPVTGGASPVRTVDHLPALLLRQDPELTAVLIERTLGPLAGGDPNDDRRRWLAETLLACLEHGFNATAVAAHLNMHPQTIRYRIRQIREVFAADDLDDPARRLALHLALEAWLAPAPAT